MTRTSKQLRSSQKEAGELERNLTMVQDELAVTRQTLENERQQQVELSEQMIKVASKCKTDDKVWFFTICSIIADN